MKQVFRKTEIKYFMQFLYKYTLTYISTRILVYFRNISRGAMYVKYIGTY